MNKYNFEYVIVYVNNIITKQIFYELFDNLRLNQIGTDCYECNYWIVINIKTRTVESYTQNQTSLIYLRENHTVFPLIVKREYKYLLSNIFKKPVPNYNPKILRYE